MSPAELRRQIAARKPAGLYVLTGSDEAEKSELAALFGDLVEPELRAFNVERLYGTDRLKALDVVAAARTLPMMADRRVVVVLQADRLLTPKRRAGDAAEEEVAGDEGLDALIDYISGRDYGQTTLVFVLAPPEPGGDARKGHALLPLHGAARITKALARAATIVACGEFGSEREIVHWLIDRARAAGLTIDPAASRRLVQLAGGDPAKFRADADRVLTFAAGEGTVTLEHVHEAIAGRETSNDDWALVRALERGQAADALRELRVRMEGGEVAYRILGQIGYAVRNPRGRFPGHRLPAAVDALFRTDVALKSSGGDPRVLMERLIVELCG